MTEFECRECGETTPLSDDGVVSDGQLLECHDCDAEFFVYLHDRDTVARNLMEWERTVSYLFVRCKDEGLLAVDDEDKKRVEELLQFLERLKAASFENRDQK